MAAFDIRFLKPRQVAVVKIVYDAVFSAVSFGLAFITRVAIEFFTKDPVLFNAETVDRHIAFFKTYLLPFVAVTLVAQGALGFYRKETTERRATRPYLVVLAIGLTVGLWSLLMYYAFSQPMFPRGVTLLSGIYLTLLVGLPRIIKYYVQEQMIIQVHHHFRSKVRNVLVIGGGGYVGSPLVSDLLRKEYKVRVLDLFLFGKDSLRDMPNPENLEVIEGDFRNVETIVRAMRGVDAVVHLGGIVGDPACSLDDDLTIDINLSATTMLAELCKVFRIRRFVFASSCSVYGAGAEGEVLTEQSGLNPVSLYAKTKIASENVLMGYHSKDFAPTILRFATLFGLSRRPRFDLVVNLLAAKAVQEGKIGVFGGSQWRPFIHIRDISKTITAVLEAPLDRVGGEVFNVGANCNNHRIVEVAQMILDTVPGTQLDVNTGKEDDRNYNVSFDKLERILDIKLGITVRDGVQEIVEACKKGDIKDYKRPEYSNLVQTKKFLSDFEVQDLPEDTTGLVKADRTLQTAKKTSRSIIEGIQGPRSSSSTN